MGSKKKKKRGRGRICGWKPGRGKSHHQRVGERDFGGRIAQAELGDGDMAGEAGDRSRSGLGRHGGLGGPVGVRG